MYLFKFRYIYRGERGRQEKNRLLEPENLKTWTWNSIIRSSGVRGDRTIPRIYNVTLAPIQ